MTVEELIAKWGGLKGGAERANFQPFIGDFCRALGLPEPDPAEAGTLGAYRYEAPVRPDAPPGGRKTTQRIDLYRRGCFVLEAKQSQLKPGETAPAEAAAPTPAPIIMRDLFGAEIVAAAPAPQRKAALRAYDRLMEGALAQAKGYALALPADHGWPPFLIVCDVGRAFEIHFDWAGNGKGYGFFPDQKSYRVELADLRSTEIRDRLTGIWKNPAGVDPRRKAVRVTREIAGRLAKVSKSLEQAERAKLRSVEDWAVSRGIEETSLFLMRMLFCMFAEDVGLLPAKAFEGFLTDAAGKSDQYWRSGLSDLWSRMDKAEAADRYWSFGDAVIRYFNGNLFTGHRIFDLPKEEKGELVEAARAQWKEVEPAIFGTLLEQALTDSERARLGAHYTPRPYVERLVEATMTELLRAQWEAVRSPAEGMAPELDAVLAFHARLADIRVLDPACGTGNFLYVAMEQLLRLEAEVAVLAAQLGGAPAPGVGPNQFLGLELNPRAAVIAELVLWIGWLRFRLANDPASIGEPVLPPLNNINGGRHGGMDALLAADPVTGAADLETPVAAAWPEADFIVGNPPFIGKGAAMRSALGSAYVEALWGAYPAMPRSADLVMFWWDRAAAALTAPHSRLRRFGLVTTNSITGSFNRRVVEARVQGEAPLSLVMAVGDHPWTRAGLDDAAVRIAMTVAAAGHHHGRLIEIVREAGLDTDTPELTEIVTSGRINPDLTIGADTTRARSLQANEGISCNGMMLAGQGFKLTGAQADYLKARDGPAADEVIRPYVGGGELLAAPLGRYVIDLFGWTEKQVRQKLPATYQHLLVTVKPERDGNRDSAFRERWWLFGRNRQEHRQAIRGTSRYIGTTETSKHRVFQFIQSATVPDHMVVAIASDEGFYLGVLSSSIHTEWCLRTGAWLGVGNDNRYSKSRVFDPFPFPDTTPEQRVAIGALAEELDMTRRLALDENGGLTMTGLYNLVAKLRAGAALGAEEEAAATRARARIVMKLHDDLDLSVAQAYGWPAGLAPDAIVARLVALNAERAAEEREGRIRWLRPEYQQARFGLGG